MEAISRLQRAKDYILAHKDQSKREQAIGAEVSEAMIAIARRDLVAAGLLEVGRSTAIATEAAVKKADAKKAAPLLDHTAMAQIAEMEALTGDDVDDEVVQKKMLKQCIRFAFDPNLHPDTRMSASTLWGKLKSQQREKQLGPQVPITFDAGVARLADMLRACGSKMVLAAFNLVYEATDEGKLSADHGQAESGPAGTPTTS
jgi:hypothetical protein